MGYSGVSGMLAAFITSPFGGALLGLESAQGGLGGLQTYFWVLFPSLLASAVATVVFVLLSGTFFETLVPVPGLCAPAGGSVLRRAAGPDRRRRLACCSWLSLRRLQQLLAADEGSHVVLRGLLGGLGMGIIGALLPLTLFSGEEETTDLIIHAAEIGVVMLIVLGLAKLFATSLSARHRLERRLYLPDHVRQRRPGPGGESDVSRHPGCGHRRGDDGGRARRRVEGASVRGALYDWSWCRRRPRPWLPSPWLSAPC